MDYRSNEIKSFAVIQTAFLGDITLTLPLINTLKEYFPECKIVFITTPAAHSLCKDFSAIDEVIVYDKKGKDKSFGNTRNFAKRVAEHNIDVLLVPHKSFRSALLSLFIRYFSKNRVKTIGFDDNSFSFLLNKRVRYNKNGHEVEKLHSLLKPLLGNTYRWQNKSVSYVSLFKNTIEEPKIEKSGRNTVAIAPASVWKTKQWSEENYIRLSKMLVESGRKVVIIGGSSDSELCERIAQKANCESLAGKLTLTQTVLLLSQVTALVSNDSAPAHLGYLAGIPVIMIYGPTVPEFGFYPLGNHSTVIQNTSLSCRPCHHHGLHKCPLGTHECMESVKPDYVLKEVERILSECS